MHTILGLNFFHANAAAAIFVDGKLVAAAEEERFNRVNSQPESRFARSAFA